MRLRRRLDPGADVFANSWELAAQALVTGLAIQVSFLWLLALGHLFARGSVVTGAAIAAIVAGALLLAVQGPRTSGPR